jgi:hypothetical protein
MSRQIPSLGSKLGTNILLTLMTKFNILLEISSILTPLK